MPTTFLYERNEGIDFLVHYLKGGTADVTVGIYIGGHPSSFIEDPKNFEDGLIGGRAVKWAEEEQDDSYVAETKIEWFLIPDPGYEGEVVLNQKRVHVFLTADRKKDLAALKEFCESLRLIRHQEPFKSEQAGSDQPATDPE